MFLVHKVRRIVAALFIATVCYGLGPSVDAAVVYSETFTGASVPANWFAQNGSAGMATLGIVDESAGIGDGNALSITAATRQGTIGDFTEVSFAGVGDKIELSFDVRLLTYPNNPGGFRFGLYHDNSDTSGLSSGYRTFIGTGTSNRTTVQADGGDTTDGDIVFGTNRENPPGFEISTAGVAGSINNNDPHSFTFVMTRTTDGVRLEPFQNGVSILPNTTEHIPGTGAGTATPLQLRFNRVAFSTNGGITGMIDNVEVSYTAAPTSVPGDFNGDLNVDGTDFVAWQSNFPKTTGAMLSEGDADGDGDVDGADFVVWQTNFPFTSSPAASPVPEPSGILLVLAGSSVGLVSCYRRRGRK